MTHQSCVLSRLVSDKTGNTLAIVAASIIPMMAMIGGGVDASRTYMAKTQLQAACDAGVLAGRRAMAQSGNFGDAEKTIANDMFNVNFTKDSTGATEVSFTTAGNDEGQVSATAKADIPMVIMKYTGLESLPIKAECTAELQLSSSDIMFVLDTTGSMAGSRITGLRQAVRDFHSTIASAVTSSEVRIRYGFVPYSTTVNAKELITKWGMPITYFAASAPYQSREAEFNTPVYAVASTNTSGPKQTTQTGVTQSSCTNSTSTSGSAPNPVTTTTYSGATWTKTSGGKGNNKNATGTCKRNETTTTTTYEVQYSFTRWIYKQQTFDTSDFRNFVSSGLANNLSSARVPAAGSYNIQTLTKLNNVPGSGITGVRSGSSTWDGCLEERDTVAASNFSPVPAGAYDLDINLEPYNDATRWKPIWSDSAFYRSAGVSESTSGTSASAPCPAPMLLFQEVDPMAGPNVPAWMGTYLDNLVATGNTYHDIGIIWGARLASPHGIFAANVNEGDIKDIQRHLIFMTDGQMEPSRTVYNAYGIEQNDNRIGPSGSSNAQLTTRHIARFRAACDAAKAEGYIVYAISFGTSLTEDLKYCATGDRAYSSNNVDELRNTFRFIASQVAGLRLSR